MTNRKRRPEPGSRQRQLLHQPGMGEAGGGEEGRIIIKKLSRGILLPFFALLACVVIIVLLVFLSADRIDQYARTKSSVQVESLIQLERSRLADLSLEYGWWNEAVEMVVYQKDLQWADDNLGSYLHDRYDISWVLSLDHNGELIYGRHEQKLLERLPDDLVDSGARGLIKTAVDTRLENPVPATAIIELDGRPVVVAVSSFATYAPTEYSINKSHGALILVKEIGEELLAAWSDDYRIDGLIIAEEKSVGKEFEDFASVSLESPGGKNVGEILWMPDQAGKSFLQFFLPWVLGIVLVVIFCSIVFYRKLRSYSDIALSNIVSLGANREMLVHQASFDHLTNLANRTLFLDRVTHEVTQCVRDRVKAAVLYIDLDGFKSVNDTLGHDCGDALLRQVGERLSDVVREEDTVSRFGGDEFCVLLSGLETEDEAGVVAGKIHKAMSRPFVIEDKQSFVGASVGIVIIPDDANNIADIVRYADLAMYQAKSRGENQYSYYKPELDCQSKYRAALKNFLHGAIDSGELYLLYQPIYSLEDKSIVCVESLIRWQNHQLGEVSPMEFIPVAEEAGVINPIGLWVVERSLIDVKKINQAGGDNVRVSINVSVRQFRNPDFLFFLEKLLEKHSVDHSLVQLEITENLLISDREGEHDMLLELAEKGIKLVLDDFGTGYSSLSYLQRYPLDTIKIDKSFVSGVQENPQSKVILETIVYMANSFRMNTVAEGIETRAQEDFMKSIGCTYGQGHLFSEPVTVDEIIRLNCNASLTCR